jgi:predicted HTH domain antitoxin
LSLQGVTVYEDLLYNYDTRITTTRETLHSRGIIVAPIISIELLEDELKAIVQAGAYTSKEEVIGHALEVLLAAHEPLRIKTAVELYRQGTVTVTRAAEIAGLELEAFKDQLAAHKVSIPTDETPEEIQAGADQIRRLRDTP